MRATAPFVSAAVLCAAMALEPGCRPGPDPAPLAPAKGLHDEAIALYRRGDRAGGDGKAHDALKVYDDAGGLSEALSDLHYEIVVSLSRAHRLCESRAE